MMVRPKDGFTLIELLIVVVIIGILAAIAIPKFSATRERAFVASMKSDLRNLASLQELYYDQSFSFGSDLNALDFTGSEGVSISVGEATGRGWSAVATHSGMLGESCAVFHGNASVIAPATTAGSVECSY
jgi:prepilin-type N-terminal cleavage/methylation domain-containing protein